MTAEIVPFVPRPNPNRPTLLEEQERKAREFLERAPDLAMLTLEQQAIEIMNVAVLGHDETSAEYIVPKDDPA